MLAHTSEGGHWSRVRAGQLRRSRLLAVLSTVAAAALVWSLVTRVAGVDLRSPAMGAGTPASIGLGPVAAVTALAALAGWALLAVLERWTRRGRTWWLVTAFVVLAISLAGPTSGTGVTTADRSLLMLLHAVVAAVLIPVLYRSSGGRPGARGARARGASGEEAPE